jgi:hypothetical protein
VAGLYLWNQQVLRGRVTSKLYERTMGYFHRRLTEQDSTVEREVGTRMAKGMDRKKETKKPKKKKA